MSILIIYVKLKQYISGLWNFVFFLIIIIKEMLKIYWNKIQA